MSTRLLWLLHLTLAVDFGPCGYPGQPTHGSVSTTEDSANYWCEPGYDLLGSSVRSCDLESLQWQGNMPLCAVDVTRNMPVFMSTEEEVSSSQFATDGDENQDESTCATTEFQASPWIIIDMFAVHQIIAFNLTVAVVKKDTPASTIRKVQVQIRVGNSSTTFHENKLCSRVPAFEDEVQILQNECKNRIYGRYILVKAVSGPLRIPVRLSVCKMQFFADVPLARHCPQEKQWLYGSHCYSVASVVNDTALDWFHAKDSCTNQNGELLADVSPHLQDMLAWQVALMGDLAPSSIWVGVQQTSAEADWLTLQGAPPPESYWSSIILQGGNSTVNYSDSAWPLCAAVESSNPAFWIHQPCSVQAGWICEYNVVSCGLPKYPKGTVAFKSPHHRLYRAGEVSDFACRRGQWLSQTCGPNGKWFGDVVNDCNQVPPVPCAVHGETIPNGHIQLDTFNTTQVLLYTCHDGFILRGPAVRVCNPSGLWQDEPPSCTEMTCPPPRPIQNGLVSLHDDGNSAGAKLSYSCDERFTLQGQNILVCLTTGEWSDPWPTCERMARVAEIIECEELQVSHGDVVYVDEGRLPASRAMIRCHPGFQLSTPHSFMLTCLSTGHWNISHSPRCVPINPQLINFRQEDQAIRPFHSFNKVQRDAENAEDTNGTKELNWMMMVVGIVGIALFVFLMGFFVVLLLTKRQKARPCAEEGCAYLPAQPLSLLYPNTGTLPIACLEAPRQNIHFSTASIRRPVSMTSDIPPVQQRSLTPIIVDTNFNRVPSTTSRVSSRAHRRSRRTLSRKSSLRVDRKPVASIRPSKIDSNAAKLYSLNKCCSSSSDAPMDSASSSSSSSPHPVPAERHSMLPVVSAGVSGRPIRPSRCHSSSPVSSQSPSELETQQTLVKISGPSTNELMSEKLPVEEEQQTTSQNNCGEPCEGSAPLPPPAPSSVPEHNMLASTPGGKDLQQEILSSPLFMKLRQTHAPCPPGELPDDPSPSLCQSTELPKPTRDSSPVNNSVNGEMLTRRAFTPCVYKVTSLQSSSARPPEAQVHKPRLPLPTPQPLVDMNSHRDAVLRLDSLRRLHRHSRLANTHSEDESPDHGETPVPIVYASSPSASIPRPALRIHNSEPDKRIAISPHRNRRIPREFDHNMNIRAPGYDYNYRPQQVRAAPRTRFTTEEMSLSSGTDSDPSHEDGDHRYKPIVIKPKRRVRFDTDNLARISYSDSESNENNTRKHNDRRQATKWNENNVLLDDRALQMILEGDTFQLDHSFLEPVQLARSHRRQPASHSRPKPAPRVSLQQHAEKSRPKSHRHRRVQFRDSGDSQEEYINRHLA